MSEEKLFAILKIKKSVLLYIGVYNDSNNNNLTHIKVRTLSVLCVHYFVHILPMAKQRI